MFSSKSFIVSSLTFKFLIHFEFSFVYGIHKCSNFILLHVAVQFSQRHSLKRLYLFSIVYYCLLCQRQGVHRYLSLSLGFLSCFIGLYFCFCATIILS